MYQGRIVYALLMTFQRCVATYNGERKVKNFSFPDRNLCMACVQLTYRESLSDIESSIRARSAKRHHLGIPAKVSRNTLANAIRDWRIYVSFAERLVGIAFGLNAETPFGMGSAETVDGLDATTIDLCLPVFSGRHSARRRRSSARRQLESTPDDN